MDLPRAKSWMCRQACSMSNRSFRVVGFINRHAGLLDGAKKVRVPDRRQRDKVHGSVEQRFKRLQQPEISIRVPVDRLAFKLDEKIQIAALGVEALRRRGAE